MKKSVLALAVLGAFAGAAAAQSSVTLYGRLDTTINYAEPGTGDGTWRMNGSAPIGGSRWGLRGTEDIGGGLKVNFVLESGFNSDTGAPGSTTKLFDRLAWVGLSSATLGDLRLGRQDSLTRQNDLGFSDISSEGELTVTEGVGGRTLFQNFGNRVDNSVGYYSPSFGGFRVNALVGLGEGAAARQQGVMFSYAGGPLKAALSYEALADLPGSNGNSYNETITLGGSYDFGIATLLLSMQKVDDFGAAPSSGTDVDAYNIGVMVPFGAFQFRAQYTESTRKPAVGADLDTDKFGVSLRYALSKRTTVYGVATTRGGDGSSAFAKENEIALGIGHNF